MCRDTGAKALKKEERRRLLIKSSRRSFYTALYTIQASLFIPSILVCVGRGDDARTERQTAITFIPL